MSEFSNKLNTSKDSAHFNVGSQVQWKWMGRFISGIISEIHTTSVSQTIKGKVIKRNGSKDNPAYLVQSEAGNFALKLGSELEAVGAKKTAARQPKMFSK